MMEKDFLRNCTRLCIALCVALVTLLAFSQIHAGEAENNALPSLVKCYSDTGFCSGVVVDPSGIVLTAKHCGASDVIEVQLQGSEQRLKAVKILEDAPPEGAVSYRLPPGKYKYSPIAKSPPEPGDSVFSIGYPGGKLASGSGVITGSSLASASWEKGLFFENLTDITAAPGWSGGPLFNDSGEVIGLCSNGNESGTAFVNYSSICRVYAQSVADPIRVVAFTFPRGECIPCDRLKASVKKGEFPGYEFEFIEFNTRLQTFSDPALFQQFMRECPSAAGSGFPVIWLPGTGEDGYRSGFESQNKLIAFMERIAGFVIHGRRSALPPSSIQPQPDPIGFEQLADKVREDAIEASRSIAEAAGRDAIAEAKAASMLATAEVEAELIRMRGNATELVEKLRLLSSDNAGLVQKVSTLRDVVNNNLAEGREDVETIRATVKDVKADPLAWLGLLGGIIHGVIRRRAGIA